MWWGTGLAILAVLAIGAALDMAVIRPRRQPVIFGVMATLLTLVGFGFRLLEAPILKSRGRVSAGLFIVGASTGMGVLWYAGLTLLRRFDRH